MVPNPSPNPPNRRNKSSDKRAFRPGFWHFFDRFYNNAEHCTCKKCVRKMKDAAPPRNSEGECRSQDCLLVGG